VVSALAYFKESKVSDALKPLAEKDPSYFVEAEAIHSWAVSQYFPLQTQAEKNYVQIEAFLIQQLKKDSYRDVIRSSALTALAELPGIGRGERPQALSQIVQWTRRGGSTDVRAAAVRSLGKVLKSAHASIRSEILSLFDDLTHEDNFRLRMQMVFALEESGYAEAMGVLGKARQLDTDGRVKRAAQNAIDSLRTAGGVPDSVVTLKASLEKLEEEYRKLKSSVEEQKSGKSEAVSPSR
jgi:aminopeptidase N